MHPNPRSNFFHLCIFRGKFGQVRGWRPAFVVGVIPSGKSWIRYCLPAEIPATYAGIWNCVCKHLGA